MLDADIRGFFDNLDKSWLIKFVEHRVADPRILRLIQKWLNAGVMEEGEMVGTRRQASPQGSVVSPLLANIYLHYAFDLWGEKCGARSGHTARWWSSATRTTSSWDSSIKTDADRFLENLQERLAMFGLELHPDKTRRIEFGRFAEENRRRRGEGKPERSISWLTHISGKNSLGRFTVRRKTIRKRIRAKLGALSRSSTSECTIPCARPANGSNRSCKATSTTTRYRETSPASPYSGTGYWCYGGISFAAAARHVRSPDAYARLGRPMVSSTASAPSLPRGSLCRQSSAIRTGCANDLPFGSEEGVASNHDPYSDLIVPIALIVITAKKSAEVHSEA